VHVHFAVDEPTNDLDIDTLETLEDSLNEFPGAIVLITHDRALLDRLTNCVIGLGVPGPVPLLADYRQWDTYVAQNKPSNTTNQLKKSAPAPVSAVLKPAVTSKLTFHEKKELETMEKSIFTLEEKIAKMNSVMHEHSNNNLTELQEMCKEIDAAQNKLERLYHRWQELESKNG